jgi:mycoredoxin
MIVYTTSWCGDCHRIKGQLRENHIPYEERDIEQNESDYQTMLGYTNGKRVIPTVDIEGKILINPSFSQVTDALKDSSET